MLRRQNRLRREYLHRKATETTAKQIYDRKQKLKTAIETGAPIPKDIRQAAVKIQKQLAFDEAEAAPTTHVDDEYANAGVRDPKILLTTSRDPSSRLNQFAKEMRLTLPNSQRINRGGYDIGEIVQACKTNDVTDLVIIHEHRGKPDGMIVTHFPFGPTAYFSLHNVVLRHDSPDQPTISEQYPHLIFNNFTTPLGQRVSNILKYLFPVPKPDSHRVMTFNNDDDFISFRHHVYTTVDGKVQLAEVGPRFEMKVYEIKLGTPDVPDADVEWALRSYHGGAKKRVLL